MEGDNSMQIKDNDIQNEQNVPEDQDDWHSFSEKKPKPGRQVEWTASEDMADYDHYDPITEKLTTCDLRPGPDWEWSYSEEEHPLGSKFHDSGMLNESGEKVLKVFEQTVSTVLKSFDNLTDNYPKSERCKPFRGIDINQRILDNFFDPEKSDETIEKVKNGKIAANKETLSAIIIKSALINSLTDFEECLFSDLWMTGRLRVFLMRTTSKSYPYQRSFEQQYRLQIKFQSAKTEINNWNAKIPPLQRWYLIPWELAFR